MDLFEETADKLQAFEIKWSENKKVRFPQTFTTNYPEALTHVVNPKNIEQYLIGEPTGLLSRASQSLGDL